MADMPAGEGGVWGVAAFRASVSSVVSVATLPSVLCGVKSGPVLGVVISAFDFASVHVAQIVDQLFQLAVADYARAKCGHASLGPASEALRVADVLLEEVTAEVFGRVVRNIQVGAEL